MTMRLTHWLCSLDFHRGLRSGRRRRQPSAYQPAAEILEHRQLLTPQLTMIAPGTIELIGTTEDDVVEVGQDGSSLTFEIQSGGFALSEVISAGLVDTIIVEGGQGNDVITIDVDDPINAIVQAGDGDDVVTTSGGHDVIEGGAGNDLVFAGGGMDEVYGGMGDDTLDGGDGEDLIQGNDGNDQICGGDGRDELIGGAGHDVLRGEAGNDTLDGGDGDDQLFGEAGNDYLDGTSGADVLYGGSGAGDVLQGGVASYEDTVHAFNNGDFSEVTLVPSATEIADQISVWESANTDADAWSVQRIGIFEGVAVDPLTAGAQQVDIVHYQYDGDALWGAIVYPRNFDAADPAASYPVAYFTHGGTDGVDWTDNIEGFYADQPTDMIRDEYFLIVPTYSGEPLVIPGLGTHLSGGGSTLDGSEAGQTIALMNLALEDIPQIDESRMLAYGTSRGGRVALTIAAQDSRVDAVVDVMGPTTSFGPHVDASGAPTVSWIQQGLMTAEQDRRLRIGRSPLFFADRMPVVQVHHGMEDQKISPINSVLLAEEMEELGRTTPEFSAFFYPGVAHNGHEMTANEQESLRGRPAEVEDLFAAFLTEISISDAATIEGLDAVFTVSLSEPSMLPVTVDVNQMHGETDDWDFSDPDAPLSITIAPGELSATLHVPTRTNPGDALIETFQLELVSPTAGVLSTENAKATGTITDDLSGLTMLLQAAPTTGEIQQIRDDWDARNPEPTRVDVVASDVVYGQQTLVVRHDIESPGMEGQDHYGLVRLPAGFDPDKQYPVLLFNHGGDSGVSMDVLFELDSWLPTDTLREDYIVVAPSYQLQAVDAGPMGQFESGGQNTLGAYDADDAISLLNAVLAHVPQADADRIVAMGASHGGRVALTVGARDPRISAVIDLSGKTDGFLPGSGNNLNGVVQRIVAGQMTIDDGRLAMLDHSPLYFAETLPQVVQVHHGLQDETILHAERLDQVMRDLGREAPQYQYFTYPGGHDPSILDGNWHRIDNLLGELTVELTVSEPVVVSGAFGGLPDIAEFSISLSQRSRFSVTVSYQVVVVQPAGAGGVALGSTNAEVVGSAIETVTFEPGDPRTCILGMPVVGPLADAPAGLVVRLLDVDHGGIGDGRAFNRVS